MAGTLVISLDFELMWGVRDHRTAQDYGDAVMGARTAIPQMLRRFGDSGIRATWATVGLLFARNRTEMLDFAPAQRPAYANTALSPYPAVEREIGPDEQSDPLHYGRSLLERVRDTEGQEIATHTYSHYYCLEDGQTEADFEADIRAAKAVAADMGVDIRSIVFPRNQMTPAHVAVCARNAINCFRGNSEQFAYRSRSKAEQTPLVRAVRLLDGIAPLTGRQSFPGAVAKDGGISVRASRFLRPVSCKLPLYSALHARRVMAEMRTAARRGETYHLWWHPHNLGRNTDANLAQLDTILAEYRRLRDSHGMQSRTMAEVAAQSLSSQAA